MSELGRVCERRKLKRNEGMRYSRYVNVCRMHATRNGEPLEEVEYFKY